ncbi:MAG: glycine cleavage system protein GcvH [Betaproteobacteria bacterium]|jgi:glycine cleavage system H protein|nr:glycine cleavage system protein GcvH [Betaproteobacteria bacterium]
MDIPQNLKYTASHEWIAGAPDGTLTIGITAVATDQLGELVYVELPEVGKQLAAGEACAVVESTKAASDVYAPVAGEVVEVNSALGEQPGTVNEGPYDKGWLFRLKPAEAGAADRLLDANAYRASAGV